MNILQGIKPAQQPVTPTPLQGQKQTSTKFIIKSKPSMKQNKQACMENDLGQSCPNYASNQDIHQLITYIVNKSKRLSQLLESKAVDPIIFHQKYLFDNPCIRTFLKSVLDKMLAERRLGKSLKGINKGILTQIQNHIWTSVEREVSLYQLDKMYQSQKSNLQKQLNTRRQEIQKQIEQLTTNDLEKDLIVSKQINEQNGDQL